MRAGTTRGIVGLGRPARGEARRMAADVETSATRPPVAGDDTALDRFFHLRERGTTVGTEVRGGVTTFIVMAYILFVNPIILSVLTQGRGPDFAATVTMTALAAGVMTLAMGLYANYPFALASGLGLNAVVAFE